MARIACTYLLFRLSGRTMSALSSTGSDDKVLATCVTTYYII